MAGSKVKKAPKVDPAVQRTKYTAYRRKKLAAGKPYVNFKDWVAGKR